ncbi:hypothetical protein DN752_00915 [Echinicola strongylocentroti]|uniref:SPOR domain-containing protein n=1 Tax=Echinicola strongylocentroti TaxID=1795355 RepID=A0A2Z4IDM1_9BACT|nr:SPOR domain-containing protein [Echinicola strongylocentroti]AWW28807.1 hypothetical protein DN752_00915 [Echinicola strongylocentroti]
MTDKDQGKKSKRKDEDKDFGLPEIEITPISSEEDKSDPTPAVVPVPTGGEKKTPKATSRKQEKEEKEASTKVATAPIPEAAPAAPVPPDDDEKEEKNNKAGWIILVLLLLGLIGFGVYHFVLRTPVSPEIPEKVTVEPAEEEPAPVVEEAPAPPVAEEPAAPSLTEISEKGSAPRYLVTVGAFIDGDLAKDFSDRLIKKGYSTYIVLPGHGSSFYKLAIADFDNVDDALVMIDQEQENFEETLWVFKF